MRWGSNGSWVLVAIQTAWAWLHKMRRAMVRPGRERLSGLVEVDETYVGGLEKGVHGRQTEKKTIVVIAVEIRLPKGFGRVRLGRVPDVSARSLVPFVRVPLSQARSCTPMAGRDTTNSPSGDMSGRSPSSRPLQSPPMS